MPATSLIRERTSLVRLDRRCYRQQCRTTTRHAAAMGGERRGVATRVEHAQPSHTHKHVMVTRAPYTTQHLYTCRTGSTRAKARGAAAERRVANHQRDVPPSTGTGEPCRSAAAPSRTPSCSVAPHASTATGAGVSTSASKRVERYAGACAHTREPCARCGGPSAPPSTPIAHAAHATAAQRTSFQPRCLAWLRWVCLTKPAAD